MMCTVGVGLHVNITASVYSYHGQRCRWVGLSAVKLEFHGTDIDTYVLADFHARIATSRTRTRILADLSDTRRDFPREDVR